MPIERITLEELSKISDKAVHINVSNHVRDIAEGAAKVFCDSCKYAAQKGQRSYSGYAAGQYTLHRYIFTDRSAIQENKNTIVDWTEFSTLSSGDEESISILDDFIYAVSIFVKKAGISKVDIRKVLVESPPRVRVKKFSFLGLHCRHENVPVPSWYVVISTEW